MTLQVQVTKTDDPTSFPVEAFIMPIVSWEGLSSPAHEQLRARTDGYYHTLLENLRRYNLDTVAPVLLLTDDRAERPSEIKCVAFVTLDTHFDTPFVMYTKALQLLAAEGATCAAMAIPSCPTVRMYRQFLMDLRFAIGVFNSLPSEHSLKTLELGAQSGDAFQLTQQFMSKLPQ